MADKLIPNSMKEIPTVNTINLALKQAISPVVRKVKEIEHLPKNNSLDPKMNLVAKSIEVLENKLELNTAEVKTAAKLNLTKNITLNNQTAE